MEREKLIKPARKLYDSQWSNDALKKALEEIFPELKESEDERIRKEIVTYLSNELHNVKQLTPRTNTVEDWIAYLEKQKEQKPVNTEYINGIREELLSIENNAKTIEGLTEAQWVAIRAAHRLLGEYVEQEQKPAEWSEDSVKFEEGFKAGRESGLRDGQNYVLNNFDSYGLCKPAEWSEEDERIVDNCIEYIKASCLDAKELDECINFLKSLRPHWKPSEVQMEVLQFVLEYHVFASPKNKEHIKSLYDDLKSL